MSMQTVCDRGLVSIIIPVYNRLHLLRCTLSSCLTQTYDNIEIILVDDGSDEDVAIVVSELCKKHNYTKKVSIYRQIHSGGNAARNLGITEAKGEYIQFLDSDDMLHPQKLEILVKALTNRIDLDMVYGLDQYFRQVPGDTSVLWNMPNTINDLDRFLADDAVWNTASPLWRRSAVSKIGDWNPALVCWQDWEYHISAICKGINYAHLPMVLQFIRDHECLRSVNLEKRDKRENSKLEAGKIVYENLKKSTLWNKQRGNLLAIYFIDLAVGGMLAGDRKLFTKGFQNAYRSGSTLFKVILIVLQILYSVKFTRIVNNYFYALKKYLFKLAEYEHQSTWKTILKEVSLPEYYKNKLKCDDR